MISDIYHQILKEKGSKGNLLVVISSLEAVRNDRALTPLFCLNPEQFVRPLEPVFRIDRIKAVSLHLNTNYYEQSYRN